MHRFLNHKITLIVSIAALLAAIGAGVYALVPSRKALAVTPVERRDISESVRLSGKIDSDKHVTLSFGRTGTVSSISVSVGDKVKAGQVLATIEASDLAASLGGANADVAMQAANLAALEKGGRPEQVAVAQQSVDSAKLALDAAVKDAAVKATDALRNKLDAVFKDGGTVNPQLSIRTENDDAEKRIEAARLASTEKLSSWTNDFSYASGTLAFIKSLVDDVAHQASLITPGNSGFSQETIDGYVQIVNAASAEINGAIASVNAANQAYKTASDQLALVRASGTPEAITAQEALVAKAQASQANIRSQIAHATIVAPFDGVVASVGPKVNEDVTAYAPAIDLISDGAYKIEVQIPESDIAKVSEGAPVRVSLDAYGPADAIPAHVASIDLSQTLVNGIGSYKAAIYLDKADVRVRTGMTAEAFVEGRKASDVLAVPESAIIKKGQDSYVLVDDGQGSFSEAKVETGISGGGYTEIASGLSAGQSVAAFGGR